MNLGAAAGPAADPGEAAGGGAVAGAGAGAVAVAVAGAGMAAAARGLTAYGYNYSERDTNVHRGCFMIWVLCRGARYKTGVCFMSATPILKRKS